MSDTVIKVENLGKLYRLGEVGTGTLSHDLKRWWALTRGKEDPFAKIGETNDRTAKGSSDYVWALRDVNFDVKQGEVLGIIGRNGAGKSTLLKLLSKVTTPSTGNIKIKGRIASLLEVGTGFHPELTGRENIFLNGAILGMTKAEIRKKFDEIVEFSGVERYIDTPVKRYSSGMYVRLAFAVAAHLEPEVLIIDEVLAVGDIEFQKKCLGKMQDVSSKDGRTILFVSHDLDAIGTLTHRSILMNKGTIEFEGKTEQIITKYISKFSKEQSLIICEDPTKPFIREVQLITSNENHLQYFGDELGIRIRLNIPIPINSLELSFQICSEETSEPIVYNWFTTANELVHLTNRSGEFELLVQIPSLKLYKGEYFFKFYVSDPRGKIVYQNIERILPFEIQMRNIYNEWGWRNNVCKYIECCTLNVKALK